MTSRIEPSSDGAGEVVLGVPGADENAVPDALVIVERIDANPSSGSESSDSQLIVVANGSFLLNLPLVNHEHRKLAGKLIGQIDSMGPSEKTVVFLESGLGGPPIVEEEARPAARTGLEILAVEPTNWILLHLAIVGILFCYSRWPIFGLPRGLDPPRRADFGYHIAAMAALLRRSRDRSYAMTRVLHYRQITKGAD